MVFICVADSAILYTLVEFILVNHGDSDSDTSHLMDSRDGTDLYLLLD